jgi:hypothetical protein
MGTIKLTDIDRDAIKKVESQVENHSNVLNDIVDDIIEPYCKDLDRYVMFIRDCLKDGETPPTNDELDDFCLNLSTLIYFAGGMCEQLGIRDDISKAVYKEVYNDTRSALAEGTVADKDSIAELQAQQEQITSVCYNRAYRIVKAKVDAAQELLASCKKVLTRRCQEAELTNMQGR